MSIERKKSIHVLPDPDDEHFRVSIFGSARIQRDDDLYKDVFRLASWIGENGMDVVTGGGPGLMEAANAGHEAGRKKKRQTLSVNKKLKKMTSHSIGLTVKLPFEGANKHLDIHKHFQKFSHRLDTFMALSEVVVVTPGGVGTCLELFYTWQLTQVNHICNIPIILFGDMWANLVKWVKENPMKSGFLQPKEMANIVVVDKIEDAMAKIKEVAKMFEEEGDRFTRNSHRYRLSMTGQLPIDLSEPERIAQLRQRVDRYRERLVDETDPGRAKRLQSVIDSLVNEIAVEKGIICESHLEKGGLKKGESNDSEGDDNKGTDEQS